MKKENIWFFIIGFIFTFAPFFILNYEIYRLIITLVGIIILSISLIINLVNYFTLLKLFSYILSNSFTHFK